ncbi:apolipoprotein N-acyltransferase [Sphingomonas hylomeconis]|uniref:Apolipoprotein N-acyltransferase n=1 Tax=Sphingomonas hylomeconis TaxID=1395958 RepID=A0ABV7SYW9_9SPHN|nr:apolipoprotein N-acyltransferase [Sphingomonas hylomeconis]
MIQERNRAASRYAPLLALALGPIAATGFAPLDLWPPALLSLAAWMWLVHDARTLRQALFRGWAFGVGHFTLGNNWIQHAFVFQDNMPHWLGYLAVALLALYLALYPMAAAGLAWRYGRTPTRSPGASFVLLFGAAWIVTEWLRGTLFTGYPWNPLGVVWLPLPGVSHVAAWVGTYALSGLTIVVAGAVLLAIGRRWRFAVPVVLVTGLLALTGVRLPQTPAAPPPANAPRVRVVQPDLGQEERPQDDYAEANLQALLALNGTPGPAPRLIVWPEGAVRYMLEDGYPATAYWRGTASFTRMRIAAALGRNDVVLTGGNSMQFDAGGELAAATNSIFAIDAGARIIGRYDKAHLVPYGEYLPARPILSRIGLNRLVPGEVDFADGPGPRGVTIPFFGTVGMQICYEIIFSGQTVDRAHRPAFLFNPSNDAWFGNWGPPEHLAQARLRAIEEGLPILRATPTGISAIIGPDGTLLATIPANRAGAIELPLPAPYPPTLFARIGNLMAGLVALALLLLAFAFRRRAR